MKTISRRKISEEKKLKKNMEENFLHPELKKLRIKDFQGTFKKNGEKQKIFQGERKQKRKIEQKWRKFFLHPELKNLRKNFA